MRHNFYLCLAAAFMVISGCEDNTITNYNSPMTGAITGRVSVPAAGTVIITTDQMFQASTDDQGFFFLDSLQPGIYHLKVLRVGYTRREIRGIAISAGKTQDLGEVVLSHYPYPVYQTMPADGDQVIGYGPAISIYVDELLDLNDLREGATITPEIAGEWREIVNKKNLSAIYEFVREREYQVGVTYQVTIPGTVKTKAGVSLGSDVSFRFSTGPLKLSISKPRAGASGGIPIWGFKPELMFNAEVELDSVNLAATFDPPIEGVWIPIERYGYYKPSSSMSGRYHLFYFFPTDPPLQPLTTYELTISNQVGLIDSVRLPDLQTAEFSTEPYGITYVSPPNGSTYVSERMSVHFLFNISMDTLSVEGAFSLQEVGGDYVTGRFTWSSNYRELLFSPVDPLHAGGVYLVKVSSAAHAVTGEHLLNDFESYFAVNWYQ